MLIALILVNWFSTKFSQQQSIHGYSIHHQYKVLTIIVVQVVQYSPWILKPSLYPHFLLTIHKIIQTNRLRQSPSWKIKRTTCNDCIITLTYRERAGRLYFAFFPLSPAQLQTYTSQHRKQIRCGLLK